MGTLTVSLPDALSRKLEILAKRQQVTQPAVVREALEAWVDRQPPTVLELMGDLVGCVHGPGDLSTNPKYLEGIGE